MDKHARKIKKGSQKDIGENICNMRVLILLCIYVILNREQQAKKSKDSFMEKKVTTTCNPTKVQVENQFFFL